MALNTTTNSDTNNKRDQRRQIVTDLVIISSVAGMLAAIHWLVPESIKTVLAFNYAKVNIWGFYTAAYVQYGTEHLVGNLVGYFLTILYTYWLTIELNAYRWFRRTFIVILLVVPPLVTLTSYSVFTLQFSTIPPPERGFSGVASGFGGVLFTALIMFLRQHYNQGVGNSVGVAVFLGLLFEISVIYSNGIDPVVLGLVIAGILLTFGKYVIEHGRDVSVRPISSGRYKPILMTVFVILVLGVLMTGMFPADVVKNGDFTNIIAHAAGFAWGVLIAGATYLLFTDQSSPVSNAS